MGRRAGTAVGAAAVAVAALLVLAAVSVLRLTDVLGDVGDAVRATDDAAVATERATDALADQQALLARADLRLGEARRALAAADDGLDAASADHAGVVAELRTMEGHLVTLREAVAGASGAAVANANLVGLLATCLDGLSELVNQLSVGDQGGAVRTVRAIGPACGAVGAAIQ